MPTAPRPGSDQVRQHVVTVATGLQLRLSGVTVAMRDLLSSRIEELAGDRRIIDLLGASIEGNVDRILHLLERGIGVDRIDPPSAAVEYARRLAQRGVPVSALVRAYRLGQQNLLQAAYAESLGRGDDPLVQSRGYEEIVTTTFDYIDWISQQVVTVYEDERERWLADRSTIRTARVEEIIGGRTVDIDAAEAAIGYRLRRHHLGVIVWVDETGARHDQLSRFTTAITSLSSRFGSGRKPLVIARDRASAWAWIPVAENFVLDLADAAAALEPGEEPPQPVIAFGLPGPGLEGFRQTHLDAVQAQRVALVRGMPTRPVISYAEPGLSVAALLSANLDDTRRWVGSTLAQLARNDEQHERLRETLRLFLHHDGSYTATADAMLMHKNSVKYRITSAEKALGRRINADRQAIELALTVCHWLGPAVLDHTAQPSS